jgi:DNA primase
VSLERLGWTDEVLEHVLRLRGWTAEAIEHLELEWHELNGRPVSFPVRDATLDRVGTLFYDPAGEAEPKMLAEAGSTRELFPPPEMIPNDVEAVLLLEGEPDPVAAWSAGFTAVGVPGTGGWEREYAGRFSGRRWTVYVIFDCDGVGRRSAANAAHDLAAAGVDVRVVYLDPSRGDGYDLSDFLLEHGAGALRALLDRAEADHRLASALTLGSRDVAEAFLASGAVMSSEELRIRRQVLELLWRERVSREAAEDAQARHQQALREREEVELMAEELERWAIANQMEADRELSEQIGREVFR